MADNVEQSVSVVAVTAAVGAVVLLLVLLCSFARKPEDEKEEEGKLIRHKLPNIHVYFVIYFWSLCNGSRELRPGGGLRPPRHSLFQMCSLKVCIG